MVRAIYAVLRGIVVGLCRLYFRLSVEGREHVPKQGPFILAPVHRSNMDSPVSAIVTRRRLRFMGKDSMWKVKPIGAVLTLMGSFPVHRGTADREALRKCIDVLEEGDPLVIFPEGTRQSGPVVQPLFDGAAYIAMKTGAPIVPVGIGGSERAMRKGSKGIRPVKIHLIVGEPIVPPEVPEGQRAPRRATKELTDQLHERLQDLFDRARVKAGETA